MGRKGRVGWGKGCAACLVVFDVCAALIERNVRMCENSYDQVVSCVDH